MKEMTIQSAFPQSMNPNGASRPAGSSASNGDFGKILKDSIHTVDRLQHEADTAIEDLSTGREADIHKTMIAMEKADISFQMVMQVRNKLVAAYEEVIRMQV